MTEKIVYQEERLGLQRSLVMPVDLDRGTDMFRGIATSGHNLSGSDLTLLSTLSNTGPGRIRLVNLDMYNYDVNWVLVEYRDGSRAGVRIAGPYKILAGGEKRITEEELRGRYAVSGITLIVVSGSAASPLSSGLSIVGAYFLDPYAVSGNIATGAAVPPP